MTRKLYGEEIIDLLVTLFKVDPELVTAMVGDISHLPAPDKLKDFAPAVMIEPVDVELTPADGGQKPKIYAQEWMFRIYYLTSYENDENFTMRLLREIQRVAQIILSNQTLNDLNIPDGGLVLTSLIEKIEISTEITDFYKSLNINLACSIIYLKVMFRNYNV